jgi:hypothetical protein
MMRELDWRFNLEATPALADITMITFSITATSFNTRIEFDLRRVGAVTLRDNRVYRVDKIG